MKLHNRKHLMPARKALRNESTPAERRVWERVKRRQLGWKFRRQHSIIPLIVDFYCPSAKMVIEVDGGSHADPTQRAVDGQRDLYLKGLGIRVFRVRNEQVFEQLESVLEEVRYLLESGDKPPLPVQLSGPP